ncbi:MAG: hypothetical protein GTN70_10470 [Deltaproteobacteria bacterium]|nr:hypothetical protein [Deltaproteobacteria bacterium]NIS78114.1 hypothetical protein [Deltaproteobacteria bacterium]
MLPKGDLLREKGVFGFFTSTKLAVFLCMILAAESIVGSLLYRGDTAFDDGSGFNVFSSFVFLLPASLLTVNIILCAAKRVIRGSVRGRIPLVLAHAFLVAAVAGMMVDGGLGDIYTGYFPFRHPSSAVYDWREGQDIDLPFTMEVSSYTVTRYPFLLKVGVKKKPGGEKVGLFVVKEGETVEVRATGLVLRDVTFDAVEKRMRFSAFFKGRFLGSFEAGSEGSPPLEDLYTVFPVAFRDFGVKDTVAGLRIVEGGNTREYDVSPNHPAVYRGMNITLIESKTDRHKNLLVGFQITRTPGETLFWAGAIGFFMFVFIHFIIKISTNKLS